MSSNQFSDITSDFWASPYINYCFEKGITSGYIVNDNREFRPNKDITRVEFATFVGQAFPSFSTVRNFKGFDDIPDSPWWGYEPVKYAYETGFLSGYNERFFKPDQSITRAEFLISLTSGLKYLPSIDAEVILSVYQDSDKIKSWMKPKLAIATEQKLVVNHPKLLRLNPSRNATRAEVAASIYQALVSYGKAPSIESKYVIDVKIAPNLIQQIKDISKLEKDDSPFKDESSINENSSEDQRIVDIGNLQEIKITPVELLSEYHAVSYLKKSAWNDLRNILNTLIYLKKNSILSLIDLLKESDQLLQESAAYALGKIGSEAKIATPDLINLVTKQKFKSATVNAAKALLRIDYKENIAYIDSVILPLLNLDKYPLLNLDGSDSEEYTTAKDISWRQLDAIQFLKKVSDPTSLCLRKIVEAFVDNNNDLSVRNAAAEALQNISLENINLETLKILLQSFEDSDSNINESPCSNTLKILYRSGNLTQKILTIFELEEQNESLLLKILQIISISPEVVDDKAILLKFLNSSFDNVKLATAKILALNLNEAGLEVRETINDLLQNGDIPIRQEALKLEDFLDNPESYDVDSIKKLRETPGKDGETIDLPTKCSEVIYDLISIKKLGRSIKNLLSW